MSFFEAMDKAVAPLAENLAFRAARHSTIAANVANIDTPGYKAMDVSFAQALENAGVRMARTNPGHMGSKGFGATMDIVEMGGEPRQDGNNVNIDNEMIRLAKNQIEYRFLGKRLKDKFSRLREAITGRAQ